MRVSYQEQKALLKMIFCKLGYARQPQAYMMKKA